MRGKMRSTRVDWRLTLGVYLLEGDEIMLIAWSNQCFGGNKVLFFVFRQLF